MKKNNKGFALIAILPLMFALVMGVCWCINLFKLTQCDFEAPYKGEIIHAAGIIPPVSLVTVWFNAK